MHRNKWKCFCCILQSALSHLISVESPNFPEMKIKSYYFSILQVTTRSSEMTWGKSHWYPSCPNSVFTSLHQKAFPSFIVTNDFPCSFTLFHKDWGKCYLPELLASLLSADLFFIHKLTACPHINQMDGCTWLIGVVRWISGLKSTAAGMLTAGRT